MADEFVRTLTRGSQYKIDNTPIEDGKVRFAKDTQRLFIDLKSDTVSERVEITDLNRDYNESELLDLSAPSKKLYLTKDTCKLYVYDYDNATWRHVMTRSDEDYVKNYVAEALSNYSNSIFVILSSKSELIAPGTPGKIYLVPGTRQEDKNKYDEYVWVPDKSTFEKFGSMELDLSGYYHSFAVSGNGNAITGVSYDATQDKLMFVKGTTFLVNSDLDEYVNQVEIQESTLSPNANAFSGYTKSGHILTLKKLATHYDRLNVSGDGNAITGLSVNGSTINANKGYTFLTQTDKISSATNADTALYAINSSTAAYSSESHHSKWTDYSADGDHALKAKKDEIGNVIHETYPTYIDHDNYLIWLANINGDVLGSKITVPYASNAGSAGSAAYASNAGTASFTGSAVYAQNAGTATFAGSAAYASNAGNSTNASSASYATTAGYANAVSWANVTNKPTTIDHATSADSAIYATSAGSAGSATKATQDESGNNIKATYGATLGTSGNSLTLVNKNGTTVSAVTVPYTTNAGTADYATSADHASTASNVAWSNVTDKPTYYNATTATVSYFTSAVKATKVNNASTADYATNASTATYATSAGSANNIAWANVSNKPTTISHSTNADTASYASSAGSVSWDNVINKPTSPVVVDWTNINNKPTSYNTTTALVQNFSNAVKAIKVDNATNADSASSVAWANVTNKPTTIDHATNADTALYSSTQEITDNSKKIANTEFVTSKISNELTEYVNDIESQESTLTPYANAYGSVTKSGHTIIFKKNKTHYDKLDVSGSGNAITSISVNGSTITANKGSTFLTQTDTIDQATIAGNTAGNSLVDGSEWDYGLIE